MYTCGITPYDATHLGHAATFIDLRRAAAPADRPRPHREVRAQRHRRRRPAVRQGPPARRALPRPRRRRGGAVRARHGRARTCCRCYSTPRASSAIPDIRGFIGMVLDRGYAYQAGGAVYFDVSKFPSLRLGQRTTRASEMIDFARERGGNVDDPNKRHPLDFVLWHPSAADEPSLGHDVGPGPAGLAHRVQRAGAARAGHHHRPARRRHRPDLPPPRVRAGAERGGDRRAVRAPLDARGDGVHGRPEDVEEPRQPGVRRQAARRRGTRGRSAWRSSSTTTATTGSWDDDADAARTSPGSQRWQAPRADGADASVLDDVRDGARRRPRHAGGARRDRRRGGSRATTSLEAAALLGVDL